jgi:ferritin-like metal-binding protein YciE
MLGVSRCPIHDELLAHELGDLYYAEQLLTTVLPKLADEAECKVVGLLKRNLEEEEKTVLSKLETIAKRLAGAKTAA